MHRREQGARGSAEGLAELGWAEAAEGAADSVFRASPLFFAESGGKPTALQTLREDDEVETAAAPSRGCGR